MTISRDVPLSLYDTAVRGKRPLETLEPGKCGVYCCGPTVYDLSHIGHARAALVPDVLVRYLRHVGVDVHYVRNLTDVDDKIIRRANERGLSARDVAERYTLAYQEDMTELGMLPPDAEPKVTEHMAEIIELIERLIDRGLAYPAKGDVYYAVREFAGYGQLSAQKIDEMRAGARVEVDERKRDPMDFALWKAAKPGEPAWPSPWGEGRPGWHIECSAMSCKHLGERFDIHGGGRDLIFPHHENEIAQSKGAYGDDSFAKYWIHNGFVTFAGEKMAKSLGNFFTIREVTRLYHPEVLRFFLIAVHYRSPVNFDTRVQCPNCKTEMSLEHQQAGQCGACEHSADAESLRNQVRFPGLDEADDRLGYLYETLAKARAFLATAAKPKHDAEPIPVVATLVDRVNRWLADDLNTAAALAEISEPTSEVNRLLASKKGVDKAVRHRTIEAYVLQFEELAAVFGCFARDPEVFLRARRDLEAARIGLDSAHVDALMVERTRARESKDFARADEIRGELDQLGVEIRDASGTSDWTL